MVIFILPLGLLAGLLATFRGHDPLRVSEKTLALGSSVNRGLISFVSGYTRVIEATPMSDDRLYPGGRRKHGHKPLAGRIERRKRNEADAKASDIEEETPKKKKGDSSSRLEASEEPEENPEKRRVIDKLKEREQQD